MNRLKLYKIKLTLEAPLLVGYTAPDHNLYNTLNYIPSITLRGGIATELLPDFCRWYQSDKEQDTELRGRCEICTQTDDCLFYQLFVQNVFTISNGLFLKNEEDTEEEECNNSDLVPTHPLIKQCKRCESNKKYINYLNEWQTKEKTYIRANCQNPSCLRKTTMDVVSGNYCKSCNFMKSNPEIGLITSTAINYAKNSSLTGYLFNYSYIKRGSIFESNMVVEDNGEIIKNLEEIEYLRLGRAKSRGFGKVRMEIDPPEMNLEQRVNKNKEIIQKMLPTQTVILASKSHIFNLENDNSNLVSNPVIDLNSALKYVSSKLKSNLHYNDNPFQLIASLGEIEMFGGWSYKFQQPKPHITAAKPGSLFKFTINQNIEDLDNITSTLAHMEFIGLNFYSALGYNLIYFPTQEEIKKHE